MTTVRLLLALLLVIAPVPPLAASAGGCTCAATAAGAAPRPATVDGTDRACPCTAEAPEAQEPPACPACPGMPASGSSGCGDDCSCGCVHPIEGRDPGPPPARPAPEREIGLSLVLAVAAPWTVRLDGSAEAGSLVPTAVGAPPGPPRAGRHRLHLDSVLRV